MLDGPSCLRSQQKGVTSPLPHMPGQPAAYPELLSIRCTIFSSLHSLSPQVARAAASASAFALGFFPSHELRNLTSDGAASAHVSEEDDLMHQLMGHQLPVAGVTQHNFSTKWVWLPSQHTCNPNIVIRFLSSVDLCSVWGSASLRFSCLECSKDALVSNSVTEVDGAACCLCSAAALTRPPSAPRQSPSQWVGAFCGKVATPRQACLVAKHDVTTLTQQSSALRAGLCAVAVHARGLGHSAGVVSLAWV
jgi:hypothetical protein